MVAIKCKIFVGEYMCNIIIENGAIQSLNKYLIDNYTNQCVGLLISYTGLKKYKTYLNILKESNLTLDIYYFNENNCTYAEIERVCEAMANCKHILAVGNVVVDVCKGVANRLDIDYSIWATDISGGYLSNYYKIVDGGVLRLVNCSLPRCIYVDSKEISKATRRDVASALAELLSYNYLLCKMACEGLLEGEIAAFDNIIKQVNMFTSENILTDKGKQLIFKIILEIELYLNKLNVKNVLYQLVFLFKKLDCDNFLNGQEAGLIFALFALSLHNRVLNNNLVMPHKEIKERVDRLKNLFNNCANESLIKEDNCENLIENKSVYFKYVTIAINRVVNNMAMLKRVYIDKGIVYNNIEMSKYLDVLRSVCCIENEKSLVILSEYGLLDNI